MASFDVKVFPFLVNLKSNKKGYLLWRTAINAKDGFYIGFTYLDKNNVLELRWDFNGVAQGSATSFDIEKLLGLAKYDDVWKDFNVLGTIPAGSEHVAKFDAKRQEKDIICDHNYVNVSFNGIKLACKKCGNYKD